MALYGQSIALNSDGCLYTFGGTTGFQYFMDVNRIDLTRYTDFSDSRNAVMIQTKINIFVLMAYDYGYTSD